MVRKLQIGCGKVYLPPDQGWVNVDLFSSVQADIYADMTAMPFPPDTFDLVMASHVLEHCHRKMILATLSHWKSLLKTGGIIRLAVPNFAAVVARYAQTQDLEELLGLLYARQDHPRNVHTVAFDRRTLSRALTRVGFVDIREWDWRTTEHSQYDDFSQCFLPHMDKENGMLMSLNLQATKP